MNFLLDSLLDWIKFSMLVTFSLSIGTEMAKHILELPAVFPPPVSLFHSRTLAPILYFFLANDSNGSYLEFAFPSTSNAHIFLFCCHCWCCVSDSAGQTFAFCYSRNATLKIDSGLVFFWILSCFMNENLCGNVPGLVEKHGGIGFHVDG